MELIDLMELIKHMELVGVYYIFQIHFQNIVGKKVVQNKAKALNYCISK
jgi:hypothetical protein